MIHFDLRKLHSNGAAYERGLLAGDGTGTRMDKTVEMKFSLVNLKSQIQNFPWCGAGRRLEYWNGDQDGQIG